MAVENEEISVNDKLSALLRQAPASAFPLIRKGAQAIISYQQSVAKEFGELRNKIRKILRKKTQEDIKSIVEKTNLKLNQDSAALQELDAFIKKIIADGGYPSFPARITPDKLLHAILGKGTMLGARAFAYGASSNTHRIEARRIIQFTLGSR